MELDRSCKNCLYRTQMSYDDPCCDCSGHSEWEHEIGEFWNNITELYLKQKEKGLANYGQTLEDNIEPNVTERLIMLQEEMVDALMYIEWIKEKIGGD